MHVQPLDVFRHVDDIITHEVLEDTLLVPIFGELASLNSLYMLNEIGAFVWQALDVLVHER